MEQINLKNTLNRGPICFNGHLITSGVHVYKGQIYK